MTAQSSGPSPQTIGLIGDDWQTALLAARLAAAGRRVLYHTLKSAPLPLHGPGLEAAATPADIAIECDAILLAIDETQRVRQLLLGTPDRAGLLADMKPGGIVIDTGVRLARETNALLGLLGMRAIGLVDAALIGAPDALASGTLTVFAGGYPDAVDLAEPILAHFGRVERTGPLGSAQTAAALMGYVEAAHVNARSEALAVGRALGLTSATLSRVLQDAPEAENIFRLNRRADLVRSMAEENGLSADIIAFDRRKGATGTPESR